jgi:hypothetical protein
VRWGSSRLKQTLDSWRQTEECMKGVGQGVHGVQHKCYERGCALTAGCDWVVQTELGRVR